MTRFRSLALAMGGASILASAAQSATTQFGGVVTARAGYGSNPSLFFGQTGSSPLVGGSILATLARLTATGRTSLTGLADLTQGFNGNGRTENYAVTLAQTQQFNPKLQFAGDIHYRNSFNPAPNYSTDARDLVPIGDILTLGTHSQDIGGDGNFSYQLTSRDLFQLGAYIDRTTYSTLGASAYTQYGGTIGYLRTISSATQVGVQVSALRVTSDQFSSSSSKTVGLQLIQRLSRIWTFKGGVSGVFQTAQGGTFNTIGFNGSLCGDYARYSICFLGSRQSSASGIGGLRVDTQGGARLNYKLSERSSVDAEVTYDISRAKDNALATQRYFDAAVNYRRSITPRISAGFSGRYQRRNIESIGAFPSSHTNGYSGTIDVAYQFGRNS